jgi:hypothetical protein
MKKRRIRFKLRFWAILAVIVLGSISLWVSGQTQEETPKNVECVDVAEYVPEKKDYILDIPLSCELQEELYEASEEFGVDYYIMIALIERETRFRNVLGDNGNSYGYCQIQPKWWYGLMREIGATDLSVPKDNFRTACAIIAQLAERYHSLEGALVAYNQGYYKGNSTQYSREVIANAERYRA